MGRRVTNWAQDRDGCLNNVTRKFGMKMKEGKSNCPLSDGKGSSVKVKMSVNGGCVHPVFV
jgi:hypothetical protein